MINYQQEDQNQQAALEKAKRETLKSLDGYTYCMVSTLNQMVNYLPMLLFPQMTKQLYITIGEQDSERTQAEEGEASKANKNKPFDEALAAACSKAGVAFPPSSDYLVLGTPYDTSAVQADIENKINTVGKICWNITGGQRPILMAILEIAKCRAGDYILYLEGNEGNLVIQQSDGQGNFTAVDLSPEGNNEYRFEEHEPKKKLTISIALRLMGIKEFAKYTPYDGSHSDHQVWLALVDKYKQYESLRKQLLALNREKDHTDKEDGTLYRNKDILKKENADKAEAYFSLLTPEELALVTKHASKPNPFGHLLEEMYAAAIYKDAKGNVAEMTVNLKLRPESEAQHEKGNKKQTDEIDIILLTKTGQLVVFEAKSGSMSGDEAKSTHYTTYAIAGVYGKPVLLTALLRDQFADSKADWPYETSAAAVRAANRAQLPIIALDGDENNDFATAIKNLLHL